MHFHLELGFRLQFKSWLFQEATPIIPVKTHPSLLLNFSFLLCSHLAGSFCCLQCHSCHCEVIGPLSCLESSLREGIWFSSIKKKAVTSVTVYCWRWQWYMPFFWALFSYTVLDVMHVVSFIFLLPYDIKFIVLYKRKLKFIWLIVGNVVSKVSLISKLVLFSVGQWWVVQSGPYLKIWW